MQSDMSPLSFHASMLEMTSPCAPDIASPLFSYPGEMLVNVDDPPREYLSMEEGLFSSTTQSSSSTPNLSRSSTWTEATFSRSLSPLSELEDKLPSTVSITLSRPHSQTNKQIGRSWTNLGPETFVEGGKSDIPCIQSTPRGDRGKHKCEACTAVAVETGKRKLERRRAQNRAAQHNYRARQQAQLHEASERTMVLQSQVNRLMKRIDDLEFENDALRTRNTLLEYGQLVPTTSWQDFTSMGQSDS